MANPASARVSLTRWQLAGLSVAIGILAALFGWFLAHIMSAGDEPPVRVKNGGSMVVTTCNGKGWSDHGQGVFTPKSERTVKRFAVVIWSNEPTCRPGPYIGKTVKVWYSDDAASPRAVLTADAQTTVTSGGLTPDSTNANNLRYAASLGDGKHYVSRIEIDGMGSSNACTFSNRAALQYIDICSAGSCRSCN